ncbi:MAG: HPF/RaiA family ribosome-associated protein [Acidobacteria bacterium]|nr:HPF/RaiA family ribosome-associated protein [Acidobacteriota bacterium]
MQIQVNSDSSIGVDSDLSRLVESTVNHALKRFEGRITRVEVHLSDANSDKFGTQDKRCLMEARPAGRDPVAVDDQAHTLEEAVRGAAQKLKRLLDSLFGREEARA